MAAIGMNPLDPSTRKPAAEAGRAHGRGLKIEWNRARQENLALTRHWLPPAHGPRPEFRDVQRRGRGADERRPPRTGLSIVEAVGEIFVEDRVVALRNRPAA